jgi:hypothetical protein
MRPRMSGLFVSSHGRAAIIAIAAFASLAFAGSASASPPAPPFMQCPAVGFDTGCAVLIVVNAHGGLESYVDPNQTFYDGAEDELVGVQNQSSSTVLSIVLNGNDLFGFDLDGLCSGKNESSKQGFQPPPAECPFGPTGYEGPNTSFSQYIEPDPERNANEGTVNFLNGAIAPGQSAYFSLESRPQVSCEPNCETTGLSTTLSDGSSSGGAITVPAETAVTDNASLSGANATVASGTVTYAVYSDAGCTNRVAAAGEGGVSGGAVPASEAKTLSPGTYYWQASYSGDSHNGASQSPCGSEMETVTPAPTCTKLSGSGRYGKGAQGQTLKNKLTTGPARARKQKFRFVWNGGANALRLTQLNSASCVIRSGEQKFSGQGPATVGSTPGYEFSFTIAMAGGHTYLTAVIEQGHVLVAKFVHEQLSKGREHIS